MGTYYTPCGLSLVVCVFVCLRALQYDCNVLRMDNAIKIANIILDVGGIGRAG